MEITNTKSFNVIFSDAPVIAPLVAPTSLNYLVVAGGGSGAYYYAGGGGAGVPAGCGCLLHGCCRNMSSSSSVICNDGQSDVSEVSEASET